MSSTPIPAAEMVEQVRALVRDVAKENGLTEAELLAVLAASVWSHKEIEL